MNFRHRGTKTDWRLNLLLHGSRTFFFKEIYFTDSMYSAYKDKLQNCSCNQFELIFN